MEKPKIRFGKFNNKWKKNKLDTVVDFFDNQRIPIDSGERKAGPYPYYGASGIIDYVDGYIFNGEYVLLAEDGANIILRSSPIAYLTKGKFWLNNHAHIMKMKTGSNEFLIQLLEKQNYEKYNTGTAQPKLNGEVVKKISLHFPSDDEQSAIGSLFRTLDDLLANYKDNLENYQSLRTTMLYKMFPKAGQNVPEIRLDGFDGEWKKDTLEPYLTESRISGDTGLTAKKITVKLWGKGVIEKEEKYAGSSNTQYFIRKAGQFIYSKLDFRNQAFGIIPNGLDGYQSTLDLPTFDIQNIDPKFLLEYVMRREFYEYQGLIANGSRKAKRIHPEDFLVMPVRIPYLEEQQAIGFYFSNIDNFINSYQEKISQIETLKKKLLQDMFI